MPSSGWLSAIRRHVLGSEHNGSSDKNYRKHHNIAFTNDSKNFVAGNNTAPATAAQLLASGRPSNKIGNAEGPNHTEKFPAKNSSGKFETSSDDSTSGVFQGEVLGPTPYQPLFDVRGESRQPGGNLNTAIADVLDGSSSDANVRSSYMTKHNPEENAATVVENDLILPDSHIPAKRFKPARSSLTMSAKSSVISGRISSARSTQSAHVDRSTTESLHQPASYVQQSTLTQNKKDEPTDSASEEVQAPPSRPLTSWSGGLSEDQNGAGEDPRGPNWDGPDDEATAEPLPQAGPKQKLVRSQSDVPTHRDLFSPDTLTRLGLGDPARPVSAVSRLSGPKEAVVRSKVTVTSAPPKGVAKMRPAAPPSEQYTTPGYARPYRASITGSSTLGTSSQYTLLQQQQQPTQQHSSPSSPAPQTVRAGRRGTSEGEACPVEEMSGKGRDAVHIDSGEEEERLEEDKEEVETSSVSQAFPRPSIEPLYSTKARPSPSFSGCPTPMFENDPKKVRFVEPQTSAPSGGRPASATSQYSGIIKNSTRYQCYQPSQAFLDTFGGHDPRSCNCPCHFLPSARRRSVGLQAWPHQVGGRLRGGRTPHLRPRHTRLLLCPSAGGLGDLSEGARAAAVLIRTLLSQVGLGGLLALWWGVGALVFAALESPPELSLTNKMADVRSELVIDLATDLRKVVPYDLVWRAKITEYMERLEEHVLEAARTGHGATAPRWTLAGALLYAASLTALTGPSGAVIRHKVTRLLSLPYAIVGSLLVLLLSVSAAHLIREVLARVWCCPFRRRRKVQDEPLLGLEVESPPKIVKNVRYPMRPLNGIGSSRVLTLDETLGTVSQSSSMASLHEGLQLERPAGGGNPIEFPPKHTSSQTQPPVLGSRDSGSQAVGRINFLNVPENGYQQDKQILEENSRAKFRPVEVNTPPQIITKVGAPWFVFLIFLMLHCVAWVTVSCLAFDVDPVLSVQGVISTVLTIDPGNWLHNLGPPSWVLTGVFLFFFLFSRILTGALLLSVWQSLSDFLSSSGKELHVTTPVMVRS